MLSAHTVQFSLDAWKRKTRRSKSKLLTAPVSPCSIIEAGQSRLDNWSPEEKPHLYGGIVQPSFTNNFIHLQAASLMYRRALTFASIHHLTPLRKRICTHVNGTVHYLLSLMSLQTHVWPRSTKPVWSRCRGIFVAIAKNTLYESKWAIFLLCQKSLEYQVKIMFHEDILYSSYSKYMKT